MSKDDTAGSVLVTQEQISKLRHDLRTPINQIIGYNELVQEVAADSGYEDIDSDLERVNNAARALLDRLEHCMADLLRASQKPDEIDTVNQPQAGTEGEPTPVVDFTPPKLQPHAPATDPNAEPAYVLVVDDNEANRDMLSRRLERQGYRVATANDGYEALEAIDHENFDAVLLDVMMPGISGLEVLHKVRAERDMTDLPIIMATAQNDSEDIVRALDLGANDYVTKPIDFPVVIARLQTHLRLKAAAEEIRQLAADLERGKQFVRSVFGRYLSDDIVENLLDQPAGLQLGGRSEEVTVLMSDLRGFSSMSEQLPPERVVKLLNHYLGAMTEIIQAHGGTIDEFIGDAILVIFGAPNAMPDHAERAVACALAMQLGMDAVNAENRRMDLPVIEMGIGIHSGPVVVGNIGSEKRAKYGVVGRTVNLAARVESYTIGGQILVADDTVQQIQSKLALSGSTQVSPKGCRGSLMIHSVRGIGGVYQRYLPYQDNKLDSLGTPIGLMLGTLDGVNVPVLHAAGSLVGRSEREVEILLIDAELQLLTNVAFEMADPAPADRCYAKVIWIDQRDAKRGILRLSSVPDPARAWIDAAG